MCMNDEKRLKSWGLLFEVVWGGGAEGLYSISVLDILGLLLLMGMAGMEIFAIDLRAMLIML
jgi:hypothetical protein